MRSRFVNFKIFWILRILRFSIVGFLDFWIWEIWVFGILRIVGLGTSGFQDLWVLGF